MVEHQMSLSVAASVVVARPCQNVGEVPHGGGAPKRHEYRPGIAIASSLDHFREWGLAPGAKKIPKCHELRQSFCRGLIGTRFARYRWVVVEFGTHRFFRGSAEEGGHHVTAQTIC